MVVVWFALVLVAAALFVFFRIARPKNIDIIVVAGLKRRKARSTSTRHVFFCFVDHYEPLWAGADEAKAMERVNLWHKNYTKTVDPFRDNSGRPPQHTFFYPQEEYQPQYLDVLQDLTDPGYGDVEVHLHHDNDTSEAFREKILSFTEVLHERHGFLKRNAQSDLLEYGFIHGNWCLDDSGPDGRWCGVKDEITVLKETGCYADFTSPSAPHATQPPIINQIYYCTDDPLRSKSHHRGKEVTFGAGPKGDLLMITGPLAINWRQRRKSVFPAVENGDIRGNYRPTADRVDLWAHTAVSVKNWPNWIFIKVHTHGAQEANANMLFRDGGFAELYENLLRRCNDGENNILHFVTARELYQCVKALEAGDLRRIGNIENFSYPS